ncbi:extracellular solute-binding protein [Humitalea sp. 24SJ18S-53]|uniref:extracellular solute-binding protein n=1 Tax=Humitalea sp. 24SJ18S-53 TaxID=3422307 RepID=UPI003D66B1E7
MTMMNLGRRGAIGSMLTFAAIAHAQPAMEEELVFAGNPGVTQGLIEREIFPDFARRHGVRRLTYVPSPVAENLARLRTQRGRPSIDVIWLAGASTYQAAAEGLLAQIDRAQVPNVATLPEGRFGEGLYLPLGLTVVGLLYNQRILAERRITPPTSWFDMWNPVFRGHTGFLTINSTSTIAMLALLSKELSGDPMNFDAALARLRQLKPNVYDFFSSSGPMDTLVQQGELWMWSHISARAMQYHNAGFPARFVTPKEGAVGYEAQVGIVKDAPHPRVAHAWVNYLLSPDVQQKIALQLGYSPINPNTVIPEQFREFLPRAEDVFVPDWQRLSAMLPQIVQRWNREVER